jgi:hypothetical protein
MKRFFWVSVCLLTALISQAQPGRATIYSEDGFPFQIMMNGLIHNQQPQPQFVLDNLNPIEYKLRIIFADTANGVINDRIFIRPGHEHYYVIKKKKITAAEKKFKSLGNSISRDVNAKSEEEAAARKEEIENMNSRFVLKLNNLVPMAGPAPAPQQPVQQTTVVTQPAPPPQQVVVHQQGGVQQTTTTTTTTVPGGGVGVSGNMNGMGGSVNVNMNLGGFGMTETTVQQTTTTTTNSGGGQVYVMPGYSGPNNCPWPMANADFDRAKASIASKSFDDTRLTMAKQIVGSNCLTSAQVEDIMRIFGFEETRLDFAKFAYVHTFDIGNYFQVNDAFQFESSIDELNAYIGSVRR